jgi:Electron transfer DM13
MEKIMNSKKILISIAVIGGIAVLAAAYYLGSPLFINRTVDEAFPSDNTSPTGSNPMSDGGNEAGNSPGSIAEPASSTPDQADNPPEEANPVGMPKEEMATEDKMMDAMTEAIPTTPAEPRELLQGQFQDADSFHQGSGQAGIYQLPDGTYTLRLESFSVTNGPDLHVLLASNPAPVDSDGLGEYIDLGELKGNLGNQNYEIPTGVDPASYKSVVIYCLPFHVVFSIAPLGS